MQKIFLVNVLSLVRPELPTNIQKDSQHFKRNGGRENVYMGQNKQGYNLGRP